MKLADNNIFSFIASAARVQVHYHHCLQVVVSLDNPYDCIINGQEIKGNMGFLINQAVEHACEAPQSTVLVLTINAASVTGRHLVGFLNGAAYVELKNIFPPDYFPSIFKGMHKEMSQAALQKCTTAFVGILLEKCGSSYGLINITDGRISAALSYIEKNADQVITLKDIAATMHLSVGRARHLFTEQLKCPFLQFVLWFRIHNVLTAVIRQQHTIATACIQNGFTDQSHFNKIFKKLYGIPPVVLIKNTLFIN